MSSGENLENPPQGRGEEHPGWHPGEPRISRAFSLHLGVFLQMKVGFLLLRDGFDLMFFS